VTYQIETVNEEIKFGRKEGREGGKKEREILKLKSMKIDIPSFHFHM
jgi:hypothetical protein